MKTSKNKIKSLMLALVLSVAAISAASARVCFLPDSTDCGEGDVVGGGNVEVPCQHSTCPAYNSNYQECYDERTYNNGGVNVTCKQIRCKLSKSECEAQEANANNSQCCNFDSASGCYYMGKCQSLCNRDVYDSEKDLGEDYNCTSCKDKNGTFYNCTPKDKECSDINSNYSTSCSDSQIAKEVTGVKDSHGNQCYTCESKPVDENCEIKGGCIIDMASIGHNSSSGTIGTGDNTEITYTCYITKAENATEADLQKIYGIMYSDFNCQSSMGQIMSSGYQRVGDVINLSSSPVSGKFTVGELTRLANCQGNTAEYNWDTKIELHNGTDHCIFTEEIFTKTCKQLGYINKNNNCSSNDLVKTLVENVIGTDGQCYTCEKAKTCHEINSSYVGAKASCSDCGNPYYTLEDVPNVFGSDGQCKKCLLDKCNDIDADWIGPKESCEFGYRKTKLEARDYGSDGQCYECTEAFTNVIVHLERGYVEGSYEDGEGVIGSQYSDWSAYLEITDPEVAQIDEKTYTLPFDMQIETMYSTFSFDSDNRPRCESYACSYQWAKITIPAGTKAIPRTPQTIKVRGYGGESLLREMEKMYNVEYFKVDYTINGKLQKDLYNHDAHIHFGFYEEDY